MVGRAPKRKVATMREGARFPTEHQEQVAFVKWFRFQFPGVMIFAIGNGGHRHIAVARKMKAEGQLAGVADLYVPKWRLWIEMKRRKGGALSEEQKGFREYVMKECGDNWMLALGAEHVRELILQFYRNGRCNYDMSSCQ